MVVGGGMVSREPGGRGGAVKRGTVGGVPSHRGKIHIRVIPTETMNPRRKKQIHNNTHIPF